MIEIVFPLDSLDAGVVGRMVLALLGRAGLAADGVSLYHAPVTPDRFLSAVRKRRSFHLHGTGFDVQLASVRSCDLGFLCADLDGDLGDWVATVTTGVGICTARVSDRRYEFWQNADDPLEFEAEGRSLAGLPMRDNELPPPLARRVVDTSRNPGRRVLREGYVEAVGHKMWLGPEYFARVPGADRDAIVNAEWLRVTELPDGLVEIVASDEPFTDDSTADLQDRLRRLLFPTTA